jgi:hypothetical protein
MPIVKVWCLPRQSETQLQKLYTAIVRAVVGVKELKLRSQNDVTVLFPPDMMKYGLGEEIVVEVNGLLRKPGRTVKTRQTLAERLGEAVKRLYPAAKVECFVPPFVDSGFWTSDIPEPEPEPEPEPKNLVLGPVPALSAQDIEKILGEFKEGSFARNWLHMLLVENKNEWTDLNGSGNTQTMFNKRFRGKKFLGKYLFFQTQQTRPYSPTFRRSIEGCVRRGRITTLVLK